MSTDDVTRASGPSRTLPGPAHTWPARLHFAVDSCLSSKLAELVCWGPERLCIYNDAFAALLGLPPAEPFHTALPDIWSDAWTTIRQTVDEVLTSGRSALQEGIALPGNAGDGRGPGHVVCAYNPLRSEEGEVGGLSITCLDDSRRSLAERGRDDAARSLRDRTALLDAISDSTGDVIFAKDREGRMRFANPAALSLIGKPLDLVLGKTDAEFLQEKSSAVAVMENDRRIMQTGVAADVEEIIPLPDGTRRIWLSRKMPDRDEAGNVIGILGVSRDITVQKRASERARRLYDVAAALSEAVTPEDVARVTIDQGILAVGATAGSLAFVTADGAHLELAGWVGYAPEVMQRWRRFSLDAEVPLAEAVRTGQPVYVQSAEERSTRYPAITTLTATKGTKSSACIPLLTGGRCVGALGLSFDRAGVSAVSEDRELLLSLGRQCAQALERARLFEAERHARVEAEHAGRMKDEFLTTLSHELRTPLNAIVGWATLLASNPTDAAKVLHGLTTIQRNARAQTQIIEDLLDMSAIISGKVRLDVQRTDLADVLQAAADTVRPAAEAKGIRLRTLLDSDTGPVRGDPSRLQQVFWNLLTNAVKFTGRGGQVEMVLQRVHSHIEITVADTGEGIPSDFIPFVFDRFRQADATITRRHGGLGLGLALVKQLTELHGGSVRVESPGAGQGTTFTVRLPLSIAHEAPPPAPAAPPALQKTASDAALGRPSHRLQGLSILVVDDEPDARDLLEELLTASGAVVRTAASAASAVTSLESDWPEVLISDIGMPDEDGYSLVARLRALEAADGSRGPRVAALALTAYARSEDRMKALRSGFDMHVAKPIDPEELLIVIASLARRTSVNPSV